MTGVRDAAAAGIITCGIGRNLATQSRGKVLRRSTKFYDGSCICVIRLAHSFCSPLAYFMNAISWDDYKLGFSSHVRHEIGLTAFRN
jgi:hypothetical protein